MSYTETDGRRTWVARDEMATEEQVADFIAGMMSLIQPRVIVETGTYLGDMTGTIMDTMPVDAKLFTCDTNQDHVDEWKRLHEDENVECRCCTGVQLLREVTAVDFAFLDSGGDRLEEALALQWSPSCFVAIHDSRRPIEQRAVEYLKQCGAQCIEFPTIRGLALLKMPERRPYSLIIPTLDVRNLKL